MQTMLADKSSQREEQFLRPNEGNALGRRAALIKIMKDTAAFLGELYESLAKAELKVDDVEDADPPQQKVRCMPSLVDRGF